MGGHLEGLLPLALVINSSFISDFSSSISRYFFRGFWAIKAKFSSSKSLA